jgi:hypothetical protein
VQALPSRNFWKRALGRHARPLRGGPKFVAGFEDIQDQDARAIRIRDAAGARHSAASKKLTERRHYNLLSQGSAIRLSAKACRPCFMGHFTLIFALQVN